VAGIMYLNFFLAVQTAGIFPAKYFLSPLKGCLKLRLTGRQCDQKSGVGDQIFRTGHQWAIHLFFHQPFNPKV